ncbi:MAG: NUDIX domain-containing protein [Oscillospiraceae bacterium]|nr:NUDIX domain-containing protein [Oscillospiraceae bacterium]
MIKDWLFSDERSICHFRAAGVLIRENNLLVQREKDGMEYALPGGHVMVGETSEQALVREFKEETGADILCDRLIWTEEVFWKWGEKNAHGIVFYYLISLRNPSDIPGDYFESKDNCHVLFEWINLDKIEDLIIYPSFLKERINHIPGHTEHFIRRDD